MEQQFKCPTCGETVIVKQNEVEGTVRKGGHNTIGVEDSALCAKCGRKFTQPEIDDWGKWV
jgi:DNA-directed RNA polymerase subunit RPC12/RpoP